MLHGIEYITVVCVAVPLVTSIIAGLLGRAIGRSGAHIVTIAGMIVSFLLAIFLFTEFVWMGHAKSDFTVYNWVASGSFQFPVGFLVDKLSATMMLLVTFVSLLVHIYSVGYMAEDDGYQRFFCYMSLFTFAMLMLVLANNFFTLFFGWEGVGLVSYLLIGFWFTKETAAFGSLKAFIVNRVGDMGMILGIGGVLTYTGSLQYANAFGQAQSLSAQTMMIIPGLHWSVLTVICILLFIGAMGKSAQMPLHVWLPESMEGPTPISAMIHAATMVTAGVYMVARLSPMFEYSTVALSLVLVLGATTCLFCGLVGVVQHDIKRVIAYSTLSQLGYMMAAVGASAYSAGMFHLLTHGCFKALLFLAAGSVIVANHHEQDMRKMGGLYRYMPITYITFLIGALALSAIPPFAGFYSKDTIIEAVGHSDIPGAYYAYICVLLGAFVTALYTFRAFFLTFHGKEKIPQETKKHLHETSWVMTLPLILLAIPSVVLGFILIKPLIYGQPSMLGDTIQVASNHNVLGAMASDFHGASYMAVHALLTPAFWLAILGVIVAWLFTIGTTSFVEVGKQRLAHVHYILVKKYGFDDFNQIVLVRGTRRIGHFLLRMIDIRLIDKLLVNGSGQLFVWCARVTRKIQSGQLYHYLFAMILGVVVLLVWQLILK